MKKTKFYSFASALMLASAMGLGSCSSDSDVTGGNPSAEREVVKTQFAINIPYAKGDASSKAIGSRMTDKNTQANGNNFLGIQNMQLLAFDVNPESNIQTQSAKVATASINIGSGDNAYDKDAWRSIYRDIAIPTGTQYFVLYGRAGRQNTDNNATAGSLNVPTGYTSATSLSSFSFSLNPIASTADFNSNSNAATIIEQLNKIANTSVVKDEQTIRWSEIESATVGTEAERKTLAARYKNITSLKAGSAASVKATIRNLMQFFGDDFDENSKPLTAAIVSNCNEALTNLESITFPTDLGLPDGVANISWDANKSTFAYATKESTTLGGNNINYTKIAYPACLSYYIASPAMVSDNELTAVNGLPDYTKWVKDENNIWPTGWTEGSVTNKTRTVALKKALQYGVANLDLTIRCANNTLEDNATAQGYQQNNSISLQTTGFPVTAVLVGGQPSSVNWNFEASQNDGFQYTIYDNVMNVDGNNNFNAKYEQTASQHNYTLVLDNNNSDTKGKVYVTVELTNNAGDFYGKDGLIPSGGKFYLVAELNIDKENLDKKNLDRVFVKDHTTIANLTITSLKNAYNCIPDLRSSNISVGLAVDLTWQDGIKFDIDI